jgi:type VI secretion system protein ImpJ
MAFRPVHWDEGMFLRPQHLQAAQRYWAHHAQQNGKWDRNYNWGVRAIELDLDALANSRLVVRLLRARLRDGTLINVPEDGNLSPIELKGQFDREPNLTVYLAVPIVNLDKRNVASGPGDGARYLVGEFEVPDENTGESRQFIRFRSLNVKLLLSTDHLDGYEVLPIARVEKSASAEGAPQLDIAYIPPLLACDAWKPLRAGILETIYDRIGKKLELLAQMALSRGITFGSHAQGDPETLGQLRILNEAYAYQGIQVFAEGIHPLDSYLELCRLVGQLSVFGKTMRPPDLPKYDHDDLGTCFYRIKQYIDDLLNYVKEPEYKKQDFVGAGLQMRVSLQPDWLQPSWQMFVGVQSPLAPDECIRLLTSLSRAGSSLDMKIGSSDHVDELFKRGSVGLRFAHSTAPPSVLPRREGLVYFQVDRSSQREEWDKVQQSLNLGIRMNENLVVGDIQNQRVLKIRNGPQTVSVQFSLYLVPRQS